MMKHYLYIIFFSLAAVSASANFELTAEAGSSTVQQNGSVQISYTLRNTGPDRHIPIGIDRFDEYVFATVAYQDEPAVEWHNTGVPIYEYIASPREHFYSGTERISSVTIFWQEDLPVFDRLGEYHIRIQWSGPDDELIESPPVTVTVVVP